jgi:hypothetical protein
MFKYDACDGGVEHDPTASDAEDGVCNVLRAGVIREVARSSLLEDRDHLFRGGIVTEYDDLGSPVDDRLDRVGDCAAREGVREHDDLRCILGRRRNRTFHGGDIGHDLHAALGAGAAQKVAD